MPKPPNQDHLLAPDQYPELNEQFYSARPHSYFGQRLTALLHVLQNPNLTGLPDEPIEVGAIRMYPVGIDEGVTGDRVMDYAAIEATQLLHHATETMFRLYMAHAGTPPCPWLEACKIPTGRPFWERLQRLLRSLDDPHVRAEVMFCFRACRDFSMARQHGYEDGEQSWQRASDGLVELLRLVGYRLGADNTMYNAMKHGLAAVSTRRGVEFRRALDDAPLAAKHGPSVRTLELDSQTGRWSRWTRWVPVDGTIALASSVISEIEALMEVGRIHYVGPPSGPVQFAVHTADEVRRLRDPSAAIDDSGARLNIESFRMELSYFEEPGMFDDDQA